jgi:hypothetical protein
MEIKDCADGAVPSTKTSTPEPVPNMDEHPQYLTEKYYRTTQFHRSRAARLREKEKHALQQRVVARKRQKAKQKNVFESHDSVLNAISYTPIGRRWQDLKTSFTDTSVDEFVMHVERMLTCFYLLKNARSLTEMTAIVHQYLSGMIRGSMLLHATDVIMSLFEPDNSSLQDILSAFDDCDASTHTEFDSHAEESSSHTHWKSLMRLFSLAETNWSELVKCKAFSAISGLLSTALAMGLIGNHKSLSYSAQGLTLFSVQAAKGHKTAVDLIDSVLTTVKFFVEGGYRCFMEGSIAPLFFDEKAPVEYEKQFSTLLSNFDFVKLSKYEPSPWSSESAFLLDLEDCTTKTQAYLKAAPKVEMQLFSRKLQQLLHLKCQFDTTKQPGGLREAPFSFLVHGVSSIGKSTIVNALVAIALQTIHSEKGETGYEVNPDVICTLNEQDKYFSDYKQYTEAIIMDDLANANPKTTQAATGTNIININNNIKRTAIMADLTDKGKLLVDPIVCAATTNIWEKWAAYFSLEPVSLLRRFQLHIKVSVKPEWRKDDTSAIDPMKLAVASREGDVFPDAWDFTVLECIGVGDSSISAQQVSWRPATYVGFDGVKKQALNVSQSELLLLFRARIEEHVLVQQSVVESSAKVLQIKTCCHGQLINKCPVCPPPPVENLYLEGNTPLCDDSTISVPVDVSEESAQPETIVPPVCPSLLVENLDLEGDIPPCKDCTITIPLDVLAEMANLMTPRPPEAPISPDDEASLETPTLQSKEESEESSCSSTPPSPRSFKSPSSRFDRYGNDMYGNYNEEFDIRVNPPLDSHASEEDDTMSYDPYGFEFYREFCNTSSPPDIIPLDDDHPAVVALDDLAQLEGSGSATMWKYCPSSIYTNDWVRNFATLKNKQFRHEVTRLTWSFGLFCSVIGFSCPFTIPVFVMAYCATAASVYTSRKQHLFSIIDSHRTTAGLLMRRLRDNDMKLGKTMFAFASVAIMAYSMYKVLAKTKALEAQGNGISVHTEKENVWIPPVLVPLPEGVDVAYSANDIARVATNGLYSVSISSSKDFVTQRTCNGFFVDSNCLLIPTHMTPTEKSYMRLSTAVPSGQRSYVIELDPLDCHPVVTEGSSNDLTMVYVSASGSMKSLIKFFPKEICARKIELRFLYRKPDLEMHTCKTLIREQKRVVTNRAIIDNASLYSLDISTAKGMCMAPLIHENNQNSFIHGFHIAGVTGQTLGVSTSVTSVELLATKAAMEEKRSSIIWTAQSAHLSTATYDIDFTPEQKIPNDSPTRFQEEGTRFNHYGSMPQYKIRPKSAVIPSPISPIVEKVMEEPQKWGPPANCRPFPEGVPSYMPYQKYLEGAGNANHEFPPEVLNRAIDDYLSEIDDLCETKFGKDLLKNVRPLDEVEVVSGVDGLKFVDAMKPGTSMGFPLNRPKREYMIDLEPEDHLNTCPRKFTEEIMNQAALDHEKYVRGERAYPVFKACTKDEPTKLTKEKVRVFQAAPASLQYNQRKYFLTLCNFLSSAPLKTECAVGINSAGPGWHELNEHISKFGEERTVAGDFKAFDQHMSARMVLASYKIFEHIAKKAGYSDEEIKVMRSVASDVAYPLMNLNGELIELFGSNASGQNMTVYTNSLVNSLYHRCVFFSLYPDTTLRFAEAVALTTYGDDCKMSVSDLFPNFNHTSIQAVFAKRGIGYTMADKDAKSVAYIAHNDADFLKRKTRRDPLFAYKDNEGVVQKNIWVAMLDEDSILKSLHSNLASKELSPEMVSVSCIEGAAREWFFHGKEVFDTRHAQLKEVVHQAGLANLMSDSFSDSWSVRKVHWDIKYSNLDSPGDFKESRELPLSTA